MKIKHAILTAFNGLHANKSRSALTILGIVIGITAIMIIMSVGNGAQNLILNELGGMGSDVLFIRPGREPKGPSDFADTIFSDSLKQREIDAISKKQNVPGVRDISGAVIVPGSVSHGSETYRPTTLGWSAEYLSKVFNVYPKEGTLFTDVDIRGKASVAVIGTKVKEELFGNGEAIGKAIKIKNRNFYVVGVLESRGQLAFFNIDEIIVIPNTTAQQYLLGHDHFNELMVRAESADRVDEVVHDIKATLRELHNITDPTKDDFFIVTQEGLVQQVGVIMNALTAFLSAVVAISLLVGGIGVMNIMLVSVTERTREIGLRKALGATEKNILVQFLLESVMLTGLGGLIGVILGLVLSFLASIIMTRVLGVQFSFTVPVTAALLGIGVSGVVGMVFGLYPAYKAAKKNPIEALRYE
ncbi:MAG: ABC transporter permease [bacterium]